MKYNPEEKQVLNCSQEVFLKRMIGLINNDQFTVDTMQQIMQAMINKNHFVSFDQFRKQRKLSDDAMWDRLNAGKTMFLIFNEQ
jgi:hypothetical protein